MMMNRKIALMAVGLVLSMVLMTFPVQAAAANPPTYNKGDFWEYRSTGLIGQDLNFRMWVNKTGVKVSGHDCYEIVATTNSTTYSQMTTEWERMDNIGIIKTYSTSNLYGMILELTTTYTQGTTPEYRFPLIVGDKWTDNVQYVQNQKTTINGKTTQSNITVNSKLTVENVAQESVTVPAGTFDTIKIKVMTNISADIIQYIWYSSKVGNDVKYVETDTMGTADPLDDQTATLELLSYKVRPQGGINYGKALSNKAEQTNFMLVLVVIIGVAVSVVVFDMVKMSRPAAGPSPGGRPSVSEQIRARPPERSIDRPVLQRASPQRQYQARGMAPRQQYDEYPQEEYGSYGNYR
jgi:hypothetical protein